MAVRALAFQSDYPSEVDHMDIEPVGFGTCGGGDGGRAGRGCQHPRGNHMIRCLAALSLLVVMAEQATGKELFCNFGTETECFSGACRQYDIKATFVFDTTSPKAVLCFADRSPLKCTTREVQFSENSYQDTITTSLPSQGDATIGGKSTITAVTQPGMNGGKIIMSELWTGGIGYMRIGTCGTAE